VKICCPPHFPNELLCIHLPSSRNPVHVEVGSDSHVIVTLLATSTLGWLS